MIPRITKVTQKSLPVIPMSKPLYFSQRQTLSKTIHNHSQQHHKADTCKNAFKAHYTSYSPAQPSNPEQNHDFLYYLDKVANFGIAITLVNQIFKALNEHNQDSKK